MKKLLVCLLVLLLAGSLFAAGSAETKTETKNITLEWWTWDPEMLEQNKQIIAKFEAENPGVTVNNTIVGTKEYWTKIRIQANQNKLPDVFTMSSGYIEEWAKAGLLYNLDTFIKNDDTFKIFYKSIFDTNKAISNTNSYYAIPFALVTTVLYYNKDAFDKAGLAYPTNDWTWEDFKNDAKKLTIDKNGDGKIDQWGFWFYGRYAHIEPWIYANNGKLIDKATMQFKPDANAMDAMKMLTNLVLVDKVAPPQKDMTSFQQQDVFPQGAAAMWVDGSWFVDTLRKNVGNDMRWGIVRVPSGPNGSNSLTYGWPDSYAIAPNTKNPEMAWKFARYVAGEGIGLDVYMAGKIPSCIKLAEDPMFADPNQQPGKDMNLLIDQAAGPMTTSYTMGWGEWRGYGGSESLGLNGTIDAIINSQMSFNEAFQKGTDSINAVLKRYYK
ncbi:MAG: sugar ABC transporter substrate-binding protein [Sphaerochaeta sp.]|jgi:multiple sugar transport system substrate-binding protein|uniref:ABC transporter substrate-binding protein n=1 Tax=Sphaerochaeta sp. TaxID=1972642 RepID=UPI002FCA7EE7